MKRREKILKGHKNKHPGYRIETAVMENVHQRKRGFQFIWSILSTFFFEITQKCKPSLFVDHTFV
jgi:hypothetical protein